MPPVATIRFVSEYRGRRIVTNGKLFGIEGELISDCRYLSVEGAQVAIDSELGIAARRRQLEEQERAHAERVTHEGRAHAFSCDCGWSGGYEKLNKDKGGRVTGRCPRCVVGLLYMAFGPTVGEETPTPDAKATPRRRRRPAP